MPKPYPIRVADGGRLNTEKARRLDDAPIGLPVQNGEYCGIANAELSSEPSFVSSLWLRASDLPHRILVQLPAWVSMAKYCDKVFSVFRNCGPFQIGDTVVGFYAVTVINAKLGVVCRNKDHGDHSVKQHVFTTRKHERVISPFGFLRLPKPTDKHTVFLEKFKLHTTKIAHAVSRITRPFSPALANKVFDHG
jgi:hypothetical protein